MLVDSALPVGGFVCSSGLEAAIQSRHVQSVQDLEGFLRDSMRAVVHSQLPFVVDAMIADTLEDLIELDKLFEAMNCNHVVKRASIAQGNGYLTLLQRGFPVDEGKNGVLIGEYKKAVRV